MTETDARDCFCEGKNKLGGITRTFNVSFPTRDIIETNSKSFEQNEEFKELMKKMQKVITDLRKQVKDTNKNKVHIHINDDSDDDNDDDDDHIDYEADNDKSDDDDDDDDSDDEDEDDDDEEDDDDDDDDEGESDEDDTDDEDDDDADDDSDDDDDDDDDDDHDNEQHIHMHLHFDGHKFKPLNAGGTYMSSPGLLREGHMCLLCQKKTDAHREIIPRLNLHTDHSNGVRGNIHFTQKANGPVEIELNIDGFKMNAASASIINGFYTHTFGELTDFCDSLSSQYNRHEKLHGSKECGIRFSRDQKILKKAEMAEEYLAVKPVLKVLAV